MYIKAELKSKPPRSLFERMKQLRLAEERQGAMPRGENERWRTAVLVIDEQEEYSTDPPDVRFVQTQVLKQAESWRWPIVFVQYWRDAPSDQTTVAGTANPDPFS